TVNVTWSRIRRGMQIMDQVNRLERAPTASVSFTTQLPISTIGRPMSMLTADESARFTGRISLGKTTFWIRLAFSTRQLVERARVSAKADQTRIPASMKI